MDKQITNDDDANNIMRRSAMMLITVKFHRRLDGANVKSEFYKQLNKKDKFQLIHGPAGACLDPFWRFDGVLYKQANDHQA